ncbi:MAG: BspA family leucine-rich repeat surface protein [Eubacteriales bacterium]|nr:BspA family leucine-rich repeat surface protein [Eubacteriales bacterium]
MKKLLKSSLAVASAAVLFAGSMPYTSVNVLADSNETVIIPAVDSDVYTGSWGTCKWTYDNGTLTIGEGTAQGSRTWGDYVSSIEKVIISGKITFEKRASLNGLFQDMSSLKTIEGLSNFDTNNVTNMRYMFYGCSSLTELNMDGLNTSNVTDMGNMFSGCKLLTQLNVSGLDTSNVTNMSGMFADCNSLTELDLTNFNTSKVKNMFFMFNNCSSLIALDVSGFDTANVTSMSYMFQNCKKIQSLDVSNFNTSKVNSMDGMFSLCLELKNIDVSKFDTSNVINMSAMFQKVACEELDVSNFDTSKVTNMSYMFGNATQLKSLDVSNFDTSNVTNMSYMFGNAQKLNKLDLANFNTSNVTDMSNMFYLCYGLRNLDISSFDMSKVTKMDKMFVSDSFRAFVYVKMPAKFPEDKDTFVKELKSGMKTGAKWKDQTTGTEYADVSSIEFFEGHTYKYITQEMYVNISITNTTEGKKLSARVKGGEYYYKYKFIMYNPKTGKWTLLSDYSSSSTYTLNMTGSGDRIIYVDVMDVLGDLKRASATVTLTGQEELSVIASKNESDNQVIFTANAAGGSCDYTYKFIVYNKTTGTWGVVQDYSSNNTCTWAKGSAGDRDFYVDVKDSDGNVVRSQSMNVKIENSKTTAVLTPSATTVTAGDKLTLTASTNKSGCTYKFLIYNPSTNQWFKLQDFGSKNTYTWTAGSDGTRQFYVDVKDTDGNVTRSKVVNVTIGSSGALSVKTSVSANTSKPGDKITFTAEGAGGKAGYTYKMVVYNKTTKTWGLVQNFSTNDKITWTAGSAGDREFYIDVKDSDGKIVRSSVMNVKTSN